MTHEIKLPGRCPQRRGPRQITSLRIQVFENDGESMAAKSKIEWTQNTWNPVTGCTKISDGCKNCYAYSLTNRLKLMGNHKYENGFNVTLHEKCLRDPLKWKKPSLIFVNSMSDLFHEDVPTEFIQKVFAVMNEASWHTFQVLTKRAERLVKLATLLNWTPKSWPDFTRADLGCNAGNRCEID